MSTVDALPLFGNPQATGRDGNWFSEFGASQVAQTQCHSMSNN